MRRHPCLTAVIVCLLAGPATSEKPAPVPIESEIASLVRDLSDPSYAVRSRATRRLCAAGMAAYEPVRRAAAGDNVEAALRARDILATLEHLLFDGVELTLELSEAKIAWDKPVELKVVMRNRSSYPARVPFEIDAERRSVLSNHARQVADMIDLAEWLKVRGPDGDFVGLRVNDISLDPSVEAVVEARASGGPVHTIPPGGQAVLVAQAFNRGWARYPFLDRGTYTVTLDYVPPWEDRVLAQNQVGRVVSPTAAIEVHGAAPPNVSRNGTEASLEVVRDGEELLARLTNRSDQTALVNMNFGPTPPFAQGRWVFERGAAMKDVPEWEHRPHAWRDFDPALLVDVPPGATLDLARIELSTLHRRLSIGDPPSAAGGWQAHFSYSNLCDRRWQRQQDSLLLGNDQVPEVLRAPLSPRLRSLWQTSNRLTLGTRRDDSSEDPRPNPPGANSLE